MFRVFVILVLMGTRATFVWRTDADRYFASGFLITRDRRVSRVLSPNRRRRAPRVPRPMRPTPTFSISSSLSFLERRSYSVTDCIKVRSVEWIGERGVGDRIRATRLSKCLYVCSARIRPELRIRALTNELSQCRHHQQQPWAMFEKGAKSEV